MDIIKLIATIFAVVLLIFAISKKLNATTTLFSIGLIILAVITLITGTSSMGEESIGNSFLDLFEFIGTKFSSQTVSSGILIMSVMGFVTYMNHLKASNLLALLAAKPLRRLKSPYVVVVLAIVVGAILKLFVPSHSGLTTLLMATIYPILIQVGVKKKTAVATVVISGAFDIGPACPITNFVVALDDVKKLTTITEFFIKKQLPVTVITIILTTVVFVLINRYFDKKEKEEANEVMEVQEAKDLGIPMFYAVLPMLPLLLVLIFSKLVVGTIVISVVGANLIGFTVSFLCNLIFCKNRVTAFNDTQKFFDGMGNSFASVISLIVGASVFTAGINAIGGIALILNGLSGSGAGGGIATVVASAITTVTSLITGSGVAAVYAIAPMMPPISAATGMNLLKMMEPIILAGGIGRAVAPVSAAVIIACRMSGVDFMDVIKRNIMPVIVAFISAMAAAMILL